MSADWPWGELGLSGRSDTRAVKRAYADRLKQIDREDPAAFQQLKGAFDTAKRMASDAQRAARKPKMVQIASGDVLAAVTVPAPSPAPAPQPTARKQVEPEAEDVPPPATARTSGQEPAPEPAGPAPNVWGDGVGTLDAEHAVQPRKAETRFFRYLDEAIEPRSWNFSRLNALLATEMAQDPQVRRRMEQAIFWRLSNLYLGENPVHIGPNSARLLEDEFAWHSDGVGFMRRFRVSGATLLIADDLQRHLSTGKPQVRVKPRDDTTTIWYLASLVLIWAVWVAVSGDPTEPESIFALLIASVAIFLPIRLIVVFAAAALAWAMRITRASRVLAPAWDRLRKRLTWAQRIDGFLYRPRGFEMALHGLATVLCVVIVVAAGL